MLYAMAFILWHYMAIYFTSLKMQIVTLKYNSEEGWHDTKQLAPGFSQKRREVTDCLSDPRMTKQTLLVIRGKEGCLCTNSTTVK